MTGTQRPKFTRLQFTQLVFIICLLFIEDSTSRGLPEQPVTEAKSSIKTKRSVFSMFCSMNPKILTFGEGVKFVLYTKEGRELLYANDTYTNVGATLFKAEMPTKIIVHGFNSDPDLYVLTDIKDEYLKRCACNVILVDWEGFAADCYPRAVDNAVPVAERLAQLIRQLWNYRAEDIHAIGFSLGAHIPGLAANSLKPSKIRRITGLDPAMPLFWPASADERLDAEDADFVDVYHTNQLAQGTPQRSGDVDFYMNGGRNQPGCEDSACSHVRSAEYFAESINSDVGFWGYPCNGWWAYSFGYCDQPKAPSVLAGDRVDENVKGYHIVRTNSKTPFAKNMIVI